MYNVIQIFLAAGRTRMSTRVSENTYNEIYVVDFAKAFIANLFACLAVCQVIYNHDVNVKPDTESGPLVSGFRGGLV